MSDHPDTCACNDCWRDSTDRDTLAAANRQQERMIIHLELVLDSLHREAHGDPCMLRRCWVTAELQEA